MLDNSGYSIKIEEEKMKISKGSLILLKAMKKCGLFVFKGHIV